MKRFYETLILIGFVASFLGGVVIVFGQLIGLIINNPDLINKVSKITDIIFPSISTSALLCYLHPYIFGRGVKKENN